MNRNHVSQDKIGNFSTIPKANILITILVALLPLLGAIIAFMIWLLVMNSSGEALGARFSLSEFIAYVPKMDLLRFVFAVGLALLSCVALMALRGLGKRINAVLPIASAALPWLAGAALTSLRIAYGKMVLKTTGSTGIATVAAGLAESGTWRLFGALLSCLLFLAVSVGLILLALARNDEERRLSWLFMAMAWGLPLLVFSVFWVLSNQEPWLLVLFTIVILALIGLASWASGPDKGAAASASVGLSFLAAVTAVSSTYLINYFMRIGITGKGGEPPVEMGPLALLFYVGGALAVLPALAAAVRAKGRGRLQGRPVLSMVFFLAVLAAVILVDWLAYKPYPGYMKIMADQPLFKTLPPPPPPPPPPSPFANKKDEGKLVTPVEIPPEISKEDLSKSGKEGGVEGGVVGGVLGGVVGGVLGGVVGEVEAPVRAIGDIKPPRLIKEVKPVYPEIARQARIEGVVSVDATTDIYGRVQNVKILRSIPLLDQAAIDAVRQQVYEPVIINGRPRGVIFTVTVKFDLSENKK